MAPVVGSGSWPACIALVPNFISLIYAQKYIYRRQLLKKIIDG